MNNKLLFFTKMNFAVKENSGIRKKVFAQVKALQRHGLEVDVVYFENNKVFIVGDNCNTTFEANGKIQFLSFLYGGFLEKLDVKSYRYVYIRHFLTNPLFLNLLSKFKKSNAGMKIFMEIPTYPYRFECADRPLVKRLGLWIDERCLPFFKNYIDRIVTFSAEKEIFGIPTILTDNGIDIEQFPMIPKAAFDGKTIHLFGLANVQKWHGYDRIIEGLKLYYSENPNVDVVFDIGGNGSEISRLKELVLLYGLTDKVVFHGFVSGEGLTALFEQTHVGVGSFGMHRIGVADGQTSTLKAREYAARGLPIVLGHQDRGFPGDFPYLLELPAVESPVNIQQIVDFYLNVQPSDYPQEMNAYAEQRLTWFVNFKPVVNAYRKP
ncbi:MAG: hypothetical protein QMB03_11025 [Spirosomataceae bacterium]